MLMTAAPAWIAAAIWLADAAQVICARQRDVERPSARPDAERCRRR